MPIVLPQGRDDLGILGGPFGVAVALTDTNVEYRIGTNDFMLEACTYIRYDSRLPATTTVMRAVEDTGDFHLHVRPAGLRIRVTLGATSVDSDAVTQDELFDKPSRIIAFADRSGNAYFFLDGVYIGGGDISAQVALDINSDQLQIGGQFHATFGRNDILSTARLFVLPGGTFPTDTEMALIANERECNPYAESPTLERVLGAGYAAARRVDVPFNDIEVNGATVTNEGTGGDFTIGGGLNWEDVATRAVVAPWALPDEDWRVFNPTQYANNAAADIGCVQGSYIYECVYNQLAANDLYSFYFYGAVGGAGAERLYIDSAAGVTTMRAVIRSNATTYPVTLQEYNFKIPAVAHIVYDATAGIGYTIINGQIIRSMAVAADLNLSGNLAIYLCGVAAKPNNGPQHVLAGRLWNAATLPTDWREDIPRRVLNPWRVRDDFSAMTLRANYEMRMDSVQPATSTVVVNRAPGSLGPLTISGAGNMGNSTKVAVFGV